MEREQKSVSISKRGSKISKCQPGILGRNGGWQKVSIDRLACFSLSTHRDNNGRPPRKPYAVPAEPGRGGVAAASLLPGLLGASADFHEATDEGAEVAALTAGMITGRMGEAERETIRKLGDLAVQAARFLSSLGTPEAHAAVGAILISLGAS